VLFRGAEDLRRCSRIADGAREGDGAHPHHRDRERVALREPGRFARAPNELRDLSSKDRLHRAVTTRCVSREGGRRASGARLGHVRERQITVHQSRELLSPADISACTEQRFHLLDERVVEGSADERAFAFEMGIEAAPRQAGLFHQPVDADAFGTFLAQEA
jgi:hypothetical protein